MRKIYLLGIIVFALITTSKAQVTGNKYIPGDYASLAAAVADLNANGVGPGGATINVTAGFTETAPSGGYLLGSATLNASLSVANPLVIQKDPATSGANPLLTAPVGTSTTVDGIFTLQGVDYTTISRIDLKESAANTTATTVMEWGYGLLNYIDASDGCQNNTIQNCTITLQKTVINAECGIYMNHHIKANTTALTITTNAGLNNSNKFYGNTILLCPFIPIYLFGYAASTPYTYYDQNNDVGGNSVGTGNTLTSFGGVSGGSAYYTNYGVYAIYQNNANISYNIINGATDGFGFTGIYPYGINSTFTCNNNTISGSGLCSTAGPTTHYGIYSNATGTNMTVNNNNISTTVAGSSTGSVAVYGIIFPNGNNLTATGNTVNTSQAVNQAMYGIYSTAIGTVNISTNTISATGTGITSNIYAAVYAAGTATSETISNNIFKNISSSNTTGAMYLVYSSNGTNNITCSNNSTLGTIAKTASGAGIFYGYYNFGLATGGTATISGNNFSNITLTGTSLFYGIRQYTATSQIEAITNNIISNITGGSGASIGIDHGYGAAGSTVNGNTVYGITSTGAITGIYLGDANLSTSLSCYNNKVYTLYTTGASNVTGITSALGTSTSIYLNKIYDLQSNNAAGTVYGISIPGGTTASSNTIYNNLIGDLKTPATSSTDAIRGISVTSASTTSNIYLYYNSVYFSASTSGANFGTSGIYHTISTTSTTGQLTLRNNIIVNNSTPKGTGTAVAFRRSGGAANNLANYAAASNNNLFYAGTPGASNLIYADGTSTGQTLANYKAGVFTAGTIAPRDAASFTELPPFLSTSGSSALFLHINPTIVTQAESGAVDVGFGSDYDGEIRQGYGGYAGSGTAPDIGADEFDASIDNTSPDILFTAIANSCSTSDKVLSAVISDASGVPTSGILVPRIYYKKGVGGTWYSQPGSLISGNGNSGTWNFNIVVSDMGGLAGGDVVYYYVIAQDIAGTVNIGSNASGVVATDVNTIITPPSNPNNYKVTIMNGTYTIGASGNYTTLTAAVNEYNSSCITGPVVFSLLDASYPAETFPITINSNIYQSNVNTLTISPASGVTAAISGNNASAIIKLNGADYVTIDGSNSGGTDRSLSITNLNSSTSGVIWLSSPTVSDGATNNTIRNCNITGSSPSGTFAGIVGSGTTTLATALVSNSGNTIRNNFISKVQEGIFVYGYTGAGFDNGWLITQNTVGSASANIAFDGILLYNMQNYTVSNNTVSGVTLSANPYVTGIRLVNSHANGMITKNTISNIKNLSAAAYGAMGIYLGATTTASNVTISNNFVYDITANGSATLAANGFGIYAASGGGYKIYYNSVALNTNQATTTGTTAAMMINGVTTASSMDIRDNIFANLQTTGAPVATRYAIYSANVNTIFSSINNNDYYTSGTNLGFLGSNMTTLANVVTGFGGNVNSVNVKPNFNSLTDLHLMTDANCGIDGAGDNTGIALADDFDGDGRGAGVTDIGADEFTGNFTLTVTNPAAVCFPNTVDLTAAAVTAGSTTTSGSVTATLSYWMDGAATVTIPPANGVPAAITVGGTYYIKLTKGSCTAISPVTVSINGGGNLAAVSGGAQVCTNAPVGAGAYYSDGSCNLIARVIPSGASPVSGNINTCVIIDGSQQFFNAAPFLQRHFDVEPATNPSASTATITLYVKNQEFVDYNTNNPLWPKMPTLAGGGNADPNIPNLRVTQYHGTPTTNPPTPGNYTGNAGVGALVTISSVFYNSTYNYWEVSFPVTGFSGFYLHTGPNFALPITINYLQGAKQGNNHLLNWKVTCNSTPTVTMTLERSASASGPFTGINTLNATAAACNQPFNYTDAQPLKGMNYYRLKVVDANGKISYSSIVALLNAVKGIEVLDIVPNPVTDGTFKLNISSALAGKIDLVIMDMQGRIMSRETRQLIAGFNPLEMNVKNLAAGTYNIYGISSEDRSKVLRFVKQ